jgi:glycosyltransferase A (GT-A) superfamily protein (DUF2064 family)
VSSPRTSLIVIAKQPLPGRVKTRLVPPLCHAEAAHLAAAALGDTLGTVGATPARRRILAFDGRFDGWLPPGWTGQTQPPGGLDTRLAAAFMAVRRGPALLVGMDTPQIVTSHLAAFEPDRFDACLGLAHDGGYWAIGLRVPTLSAAAIVGVPMSTPDTGTLQLRRLRDLGLRVQLLQTLTDVDTIETAAEVAAAAPQTAFARAFRSIREPVVDAN